MFRSADEDIAPNALGQLRVVQGEFVIDGLLHTCVSPGGTVFAPTGVEVVVPVVAIFLFDLTLQELEVRRTMRNAVQKWQLSSDDHADILRQLSVTLDSTVAAAVRNVSGRS